MQTPIVTHYFEDFLDYYWRAKILEDRNHRNGQHQSCGDPLQDNVTIYDTVHRRYAGFSSVLRDMHNHKVLKEGERKLTLEKCLFLYGIHRMTGSGASFYPKTEGDRRHGYCNVIVPTLYGLPTIEDMVTCIRDWKLPMFTSLGNQPPPFPKPGEGYETGGKWFFCEVWPGFVEMIVEELQGRKGDYSIASFTDWMLELNRVNGFKAFKFAYTAFVMDIADWHPELMPPSSQCYYGANGLVAMNAMFSQNNRKKGMKFYHEAMAYTCDQITNMTQEEAHPMDVEDVMCDAVRYWSRFVPKHGYSNLQPEERETLSRISQQEFMEFLATDGR